MKKVYLKSLKEKLKLSNEVIDILYELLEKLRFSGYVSKTMELDLADRLYENIDRVLIGTESKDDYKSGYYDAFKKEIYIKDLSNKKAVYQRFLYAMTTRKVEDNKYMVGYSYTYMNKNNFKLHHEGYGINRAVISNLASKLVDSVKTQIGFELVYTRYKTNFLGYDIISENDNYYFESNLFSQMCYALNIEKDIFYKELFSKNPIAEIEKELSKVNIDYQKYIDNMDKLSRKYSNYNHLKNLLNILDKIQIKLQKSEKLSKEEERVLSIQERKAKRDINDAIFRYTDIEEDTTDEVSVSEVLENMENYIINLVVEEQRMLSDYLCSVEDIEKPYEFAARLKQYNSMLIIKEDRIEKFIYEIITEKILKTNELTSVNLIEKIKYSLVQELISTDKYNGIYEDFSFKVINDLETPEEKYIIITSNGSFVQTIRVSDLDNRIQRLEDNTEKIITDNFRHILNSDYMGYNVNQIETIFTKLKEQYAFFSKVTTENINFFMKDRTYYLIIQFKNEIYVVKAMPTYSTFKVEMVELSESYSIFKEEFKKDNALLPVLYKGEENIFSFLFKKFKMLFAN